MSDVERDAEAGWAPRSAGWRRWAYWGARFGPRAFVRWSPPLIGLGFGMALPRARRQVLRNLRRIHGRRDEFSELKDMAATFGAFAACLAESLAAERAEGRAARYRVVGAERYEALRERGEGVLLATAHVGPWDAAAQGLRGTRQEPILLVMGQEQDAAAGTFHDLVRRTAGLEVRRVGAHPLDALPVLEWLQAGKVAAVQMDRAPKGGAIVVDLLGAPFPLPKGPFALASVAQVALLPVFASRRGFFDYRIDVGHPIRLPRRADREQVEGAAGAFAAQMGAFLRSNATQWFHFTDDALAADVDLDE